MEECKPLIPGIFVDGQSMQDTLRVGRAAIQHVRSTGPAILQVNTFRLNGHSPADPGREVIENKHSNDVGPPPPPPPPRLHTRILSYGKSCSDVGRVLVLNDPPPRARAPPQGRV